MKIVVIGAGNMGLAIASYLAVTGEYSVTLFTSKKVKNIILNDVEQKKKVLTTNFLVSIDARVISEADYILCTYPAFLRKKFIEEYGCYIHEGAKMGFVPGYGGGEYFCKDLIEKGVIIFGFQRVPYVARAQNGEVRILSKKEKIYIAAIPSIYTDLVTREIEKMLKITSVPLKEYLSITLAPSNPLLHISGLYSAFRNFDSKQGYKGKKKFYEQWDDTTSELLFKYDEELQCICKALTPLDMTEVVSLPIYYESKTPKEMSQKLKSIESFKVVEVPLVGDKPDLQSRMFVEDFPYGVCVIKDIANIVCIKTPIIDMLLNFYMDISGHKYFNEDGTYTCEIVNTGAPGAYGIHKKTELINFYHGEN